MRNKIWVSVVSLFVLTAVNGFADLTNGLVAYYPFNGNANDESGNSNHGTVNGAVLTADRFGKAQMAYYFDSSAYIDCGNDASLNVTNDLTISVRFCTTQPVGHQFAGMISKRESWNWQTDMEWEMYYDRNDGRLMFSWANAASSLGDIFTTTNAPPQTNEWRMATVTRIGDNWCLYYDGLLKAFHSTNISIRSTQSHVRLGVLRGGSTDDKFIGTLDDVRIYNRALTSNEVYSLFKYDGDAPPTNIVPPKVLPPSKIANKSFTARWDWGVGGSPEGEISVAYDKAFTTYVDDFNRRYVVNAPTVVVPNILAGRVYWYRVRRLMPDGNFSPWTAKMQVRTGTGIPVFKYLLSDAPASKGIVQEFPISSLVSGAGTLAVKSSDPNAVKVALSSSTLTLQYLWNTTNAANVTLTLTHPATGYAAAYVASLRQATGSVAVVGQSLPTITGTRVVQDVTLKNRTGGMMYGLRVRANGLDNTTWLINRTGFDPVSKAPVLDIPCVLSAGSQIVVRLVYAGAYAPLHKRSPPR